MNHASNQMMFLAALSAIVLTNSALISAERVQAQTPPTNAQVAETLANDVHSMVDSLAVQRDALGTWPATVSDAYAQLQQLETELQAARQAGEPIQFRRKYRACLRLAARITRWLANRYAPEGDELPARDRVSGLLGRLSDRLALLTQLAAGVGVTLDVTEANTARTEAQSALDTGTAVQLRAAVRRYRNALDALQDQLPDPEA